MPASNSKADSRDSAPALTANRRRTPTPPPLQATTHWGCRLVPAPGLHIASQAERILHTRSPPIELALAVADVGARSTTVGSGSNSTIMRLMVCRSMSGAGTGLPNLSIRE